MEQVSGLAATFLAHAKVRFVPQPDPAALEPLLASAWEGSRTQWPGVELPPTVFVAHLAERLSDTNPPVSVESLLEQVSTEELYLACACLRGVPTAIAAFERQYLAKLPKLLKSPGQPAAMIDDVCQLAREKLLVAAPPEKPKLAEYSGRGSLMGWVRITAVRIATRQRMAEKPAPDREAETIFKALPAPGLDAELDLIKRRYHADFKAAVREAFSGLSDDERHLLRLYFVDQLSTYELATLYRVNQGTISRWLKSARQTVYEETRRRLQSRLGLTTRDFKSFLAVLDSQLELSISQLLGEDDARPRTTGPR
ncbi:sigma-70 family RNA polymerase sigma factor [Hyalangium versicolor]|uniref:sigma-70 family RNA polymerase sigma factor n=1 Tax=Hyalangium versicolor TaxID=2861190 RepID=UPI001CCF3252|nr:sigma-70 family RNA polymerase sigma factor [Hyalangium versicolor]